MGKSRRQSTFFGDSITVIKFVNRLQSQEFDAIHWAKGLKLKAQHSKVTFEQKLRSRARQWQHAEPNQRPRPQSYDDQGRVEPNLNLVPKYCSVTIM